MIDGGDILSTQCKIGLKGPKSMRRVDDLSLIFIDFYVPALTPRVSNAETLLQISDNLLSFASIQVSSAKRPRTTPGVSRISFIYMKTSPPSVSRLSRKCGNLDVLQPFWPPGLVTRIALPFYSRMLGTGRNLVAPLIVLVFLLA
jgi:hypothetical protein